MFQIIYVWNIGAKPNRLLRKNLATIKEKMVEAQKSGSENYRRVSRKRWILWFSFVRNGQILFQIELPFCIHTSKNETSCCPTSLSALGVVSVLDFSCSITWSCVLSILTINKFPLFFKNIGFYLFVYNVMVIQLVFCNIVLTFIAVTNILNFLVVF